MIDKLEQGFGDVRFCGRRVYQRGTCLSISSAQWHFRLQTTILVISFGEHSNHSPGCDCSKLLRNCFGLRSRWVNKRLALGTGITLCANCDVEGSTSQCWEIKDTAKRLSVATLTSEEFFPLEPKMLFHTVTSTGWTWHDNRASEGFPRALASSSNASSSKVRVCWSRRYTSSWKHPWDQVQHVYQILTVVTKEQRQRVFRVIRP